MSIEQAAQSHSVKCPIRFGSSKWPMVTMNLVNTKLCLFSKAHQVEKSPKVFQVIFSLVCLLILNTSLLDQCGQVNAFHLSFGHRLVKSVENEPKREEQKVQQYSSSNPLMNPQENLIRPIECRNANNHSEAGICMFSIDCMQNKGVPLSICKHNYFVGTCCKLPDYNNFVGIVYDLRETENGQQQQQQRQTLEARRGSSDALHVFKSTLVETLSTIAPTTTTKTTTSEINSLAASTTNSAKRTNQSDALTNQNDQSTGASSPVKQQQEQQFGSTSRVPLEETSKKYLISSTKLFASLDGAISTPSASKATSTSNAASENPADGSIKLPNTAVASETARNADGSFQAHHMAAAAPSQILFATLEEQNSTGNNSAYELLAIAPANQTKSGPAQDSPIVFDNGAQQQQPAELATELRPMTTNVVLSNQHQAMASSIAPSSSPTSTTASSSSSDSSSSSSDQEFTLSSSNQMSSPAAAVHFEQIGSGGSTASQQQGPAPPSPFSDLISSPSLAPTESPSPSSQYETTTPFTSSLSTAILPNISSHPYAPTTMATSLRVDSTTIAPQTLSQTLVSTSSSLAPSTSSSSSSPETSLATVSQQAASVSPFVAQYYSTASVLPEHSTQSPPPSSSQHHHRPLAGLPTSNSPLASKIVTSNSGSNNLIPGLSGLQSAILAHIPFKLASGLSTGLSSYLQAAMKPGGNSQTSNRPLISSNTAPALQYQQQQQQQQQLNQTSLKAPGQMSAVRFPTSTTDSQQVAAASTPPPPPPPQQKRDVVKEAQLVCGRPRAAENKTNKRVARIVGGNQSAFGQWPWMVSLRQWRKGAFLHKCGAALLNENWAITAAHCVENVKAPDLLLRLGEFDVSNQNEPFPYIERRVKTVVSHPSFDPKTFEYDLALIRFTEPIQYERNIIPVCVPQGNDSYVDRMATVIGWGRLFEDGPLPDVIQHVDVPIITNQECEKMYKSAGFVEEIPEMFICAGISKGGRDSCEGDSGGPLTMVDHDGRSYLVGIISWGIGCALPSQPGVYTRITAFSSWINQMMAN